MSLFWYRNLKLMPHEWVFKQFMENNIPWKSYTCMLSFFASKKTQNLIIFHKCFKITFIGNTSNSLLLVSENTEETWRVSDIAVSDCSSRALVDIDHSAC